MTTLPSEQTPPSPQATALLLLLLALTPLLLAACSGGDRTDPGLLAAPGFADETGRLTRPWQFAHHASAGSYRLTVSDGVARIERTGHEPWARLAQEVDRGVLPGVAGGRMAFSVELRARLDDSAYGKPIEPSGLMVRVWRQRGEKRSMVNALVGAPRPRIERLALAPDAQIPEWRRHAIEFQVPEDVSRLEVSAVLATGGTLELRNPSLRVIEDQETSE